MVRSKQTNYDEDMIRKKSMNPTNQNEASLFLENGIQRAGEQLTAEQLERQLEILGTAAASVASPERKNRSKCQQSRAAIVSKRIARKKQAAKSKKRNRKK